MFISVIVLDMNGYERRHWDMFNEIGPFTTLMADIIGLKPRISGVVFNNP